ncbi:hypothetical protein DFJ74DRAFT_664329 [Hyaloraphidium curvatum]|nr:hypothetical protein DFJ74DRAFT_664329 [Hyaloraphidium curvatum]
MCIRGGAVPPLLPAKTRVDASFILPTCSPSRLCFVSLWSSRTFGPEHAAVLTAVPGLAILRLTGFLLAGPALALALRAGTFLSLRDCDLADFIPSLPLSASPHGLELERCRLRDPLLPGSAALERLLAALDPAALTHLSLVEDRPLPGSSADSFHAAPLFSGPVLRRISAFRALDALVLRGASDTLDDATLAAVYPAMARLRVLDLGSAAVTDFGVERALDAATGLRRLVLRRCRATSSSIRAAAAHPALASLQLFSTPSISLLDLLLLRSSRTVREVKVYAVDFIPDSQPAGWGDAGTMREVRDGLAGKGVRVEYYARRDVWEVVEVDP